MFSKVQFVHLHEFTFITRIYVECTLLDLYLPNLHTQCS